MNPCCWISLRTGSLVIGSLEIILFALGVFMYGGTVIVMVHAHNLNSTAVEHILNQTQQAAAGEMDPMFQANINYQGILLLCSLMTVLCLMQLLVGIVLVLGVKKESLTLLKTWMGVKVLAIMLSAVMLIVSMQHRQTDISSLATDTLTILLGIYCFFVVYALAQEYKKGGTGSLATLHRKT